MAAVKVDPERVHEFADFQAFYDWLAKHHGSETEVWIKTHKVGSGLTSITPKEAIDAVLCWGWIDGIRKGFDEKSFLQRYTPRAPRGTWSQINVDNVARLIAAGRMTPFGMKEVEAAKADGRWDRAYAGSRDMKIPDDLQAAIDASPAAKDMLGKLTAQNRFALAFRTLNMKTAAGELRWFATVDGAEVEVGPEPFFHKGETITPRSRTFIASQVSDNPYLMGTGYMATLQSLPEPLRSQMLKGDFTAGMEDDPWQVIPSRWIEEACARWTPRTAKGVMDSMGVDVARGGRDEMIISRRHGTWFDELIAFPGIDTPDGPFVAAQVVAARRDLAPVHIDIVGWGASPYDFLVQNRIQTEAINGAERSVGRTGDDTLSFANRRAELWWRMREALDPMNPAPVALPPDPALKADLAAPRWKLVAAGVQVEGKEEMKKRLGRSPDRGDAVCMALVGTVRAGGEAAKRRRSSVGYVA